MRAWIIATIVMVIAVLIGFAYYMYNVISEPLTQRQNSAITIAMAETDLNEIITLDYYHGRRSFQFIEGFNSNGENLYVWVEELPENERTMHDEVQAPQVITRLKSEGLSKEQVRGIAQEELEVKQIKSIHLGIIGNTPVYEVIYVDHDDRHSFYYVTFEDGTYIRHYQFRKT